jgi:hypothetical protein
VIEQGSQHYGERPPGDQTSAQTVKWAGLAAAEAAIGISDRGNEAVDAGDIDRSLAINWLGSLRELDSIGAFRAAVTGHVVIAAKST